MSKSDYAMLKPPENPIRKKLWNLQKNYYFEASIMVCITFNIITMAMNYETASDGYNNVLIYMNLFFTSIFIIEAIIKIFALGIHGYF